MWWGRKRGVHWGGVAGASWANTRTRQSVRGWEFLLRVGAGLWGWSVLDLHVGAWVGHSAMETKGHGGCGAGFGLL